MQQNVTGPEECMNPAKIWIPQATAKSNGIKAKNSYAKRIFTEQLYIKHLLHQRIICIKTAFLHLFTLNSFLHRHLIHRKLRLCQLRNKISTEDCFTRFFYRAFLKDMLTTDFLGKESLMTVQVEQLLMTAPKSVKYLLQTPFTPANWYTKKPKKGRQFHVVRWLQPNRKERI